MKRATADPTKNDTNSLSLLCRISRGAAFFCRRAFHMWISCNCPSSSVLCICASQTLWHFFQRPALFSLFVLLISCDRCIPAGGVEFELFIKAHESIKRHGAVGHKLMYALTPLCRIPSGEEPVSIRGRTGLATIKTGCAMHGWVSVTSLSSDK